MRDLYAVLHVAPNANRDAIRASFRALARQCHPDFGGDARRMQAISEAWATLGRPDRRIAYDEHRADEHKTDRRATDATVTREHAATQERATTPVGRPDTLDYGRYKGWTIEAMAHHDPDYLEWLRRSPGARGWRIRIDAALADRAARIPLPPSPTKRRGLFSR